MNVTTTRTITPTMHTLHAAAVALAITGGTAAAIAGTLLLSPHASAAPQGVDAYAYEETINLSEIDDEIDSIPSCRMEDGSDVIYPGSGIGRCLWTNDGNVWLTYADRSYLIVDDTVVAHGVAAADGGVPGR